MAYRNVYCYVDGHPPKTKKALKEAIADNPEGVTFDRMSDFDRDSDIPPNALYLPAGVNLQVVGPDPHRDRRWYATVYFDGNQVRVK